MSEYELKTCVVCGDSTCQNIDECRYQKEIKNLKAQVEMLEGLLSGICDDLFTPYRLGIGELPNPNWCNLNKARKYLEKLKELRSSSATQPEQMRGSDD